MSLTLYSKYECPFCWQVKFALGYFNIDYQLIEKKTPDKQFLLQFSPQGSSPILLVDNVPIWDSNAIIHFLEDYSANTKTLFPGKNMDKVKARLLLTYNNDIAGKSLREVIFEKRNNAEHEWDWERINKGTTGWQNTLNWLENEIESSESFIAAGLSIADAALLPRFGLAEHYGVGVDNRHPKLFKWFSRGKKMSPYVNSLPWSDN